MLLKLDLSKSYDKLNWQFLGGILKAFGFAEDWTNWIMNMVSSAFFSIFVNGSPSSPFNTTRGIRQGDPLSPFLFIIMTEGLGRMLKNRRAENKIQGLSLTEGMDPQTHQQFMDGNMLMGPSLVHEARGIKDCLNIFLEASDLEINKEKS